MMDGFERMSGLTEVERPPMRCSDSKWLGATEKIASCEAAICCCGKPFGKNWEFHLPEVKAWRKDIRATWEGARRICQRQRPTGRLSGSEEAQPSLRVQTSPLLPGNRALVASHASGGPGR